MLSINMGDLIILAIVMAIAVAAVLGMGGKRK